MSLLRLPAELVLDILYYLGSSFFCQDLRRLTVCKQWYSHASVVLFANVKLSSKTVKQFVGLGGNNTFLELLNRNLKEVYIEIHPFEDLDAFTKEYLRSGSPSRLRGVRENYKYYVQNGWINILDTRLTGLTGLLRNCRNLKDIGFSASEGHNFPNPWRWNYLYGSTLSNLLAANNLTTLDLDTSGAFIGFDNKENDERHMCLAVQKLLPILKRLKLRMRRICPEALRPAARDITVSLEELVVNLSISANFPCIPFDGLASQCGSIHRSRPFFNLRTKIEQQAAILATMMSSAKTVEVLYHSYPEVKQHSANMLSGRRMVQDDDTNWTDVGAIEYN